MQKAAVAYCTPDELDMIKTDLNQMWEVESFRAGSRCVSASKGRVRDAAAIHDRHGFAAGTAQSCAPAPFGRRSGTACIRQSRSAA